MEGGKCVMAHYDKENDIEAAGRNLQIRNSTVDFLVFTKAAGEDGIEVRVQNHDVWLTQKAIAQLFDIDRSVVTKHLKNIYESKELLEESTCANFAQVADNGKTYQYKFYSLSAIIAVGWDIGRTLPGQRSFASGQQRYWILLQSRGNVLRQAEPGALIWKRHFHNAATCQGDNDTSVKRSPATVKAGR